MFVMKFLTHFIEMKIISWFYW